MALGVKSCADRMEWLAERQNGFGGSDASAVLGINPWKSNEMLWEEKTGLRKAADLADNPRVNYGKEAETHIRELFALDFPQYTVDYHEFDMLYQVERPWMYATLDGDLTEKASGGRGVLEIKTTEIMRASGWDEWRDRVPDYYYTQILHQLAATGFDFAILRAHIKQCFSPDPSDVKIYIRHYYWRRDEVQADIDMLIQKESEAWRYIQTRTRPNRILPEI